MSLRKKPVLDQRIKLASELHHYHLDKAKAAQAAEEFVGDLIHASELNSQIFIRNYHHLTSMYHFLLSLPTTDCLTLVYVDSLLIHLHHYVLMETENVSYRQYLLTVEADYDDLHNLHADLASDTELRLLILLSFQDEILLRDQGRVATPLNDINLNFI